MTWLLPLRAAKLLEDVLEGGDDLVLLDLGLLEAQTQIEGLRRRPEAEHEKPGAACLRLRGLFSDVLPRGVALAGKLLHEGEHFLRVRLPNYLQQRGLGGNVGQPTEVPDLRGHVLER